MKRFLPLVIFLIAVLTYVLVFPRYPIGYPLDDALYILAAKSLAAGRYVALYLPGQPPLTDPLPGFPLLLTPFVAWVGNHFTLLKVLPLALTLASLVLFWRLCGPLVGAFSALALTALFAFNPTTVNFSSIVVSEPFFLFLALLSFLQLRSLLKMETTPKIIGLGVLMAWAALVRPQGLALPAAILIALLLQKRLRSGIGCGLLVALPLLGVLFRNYCVARTATGYLAHWNATLPSALTHPELLLANAAQVLRTLVTENLWALPSEASSPRLAPLLIALVSGTLLLLVMGGIEFVKKGTKERRLRQAMMLFVLFYGGIHFFWLAVDVHYLYPILPFIFLAGYAGVGVVAEQVGGARIGSGALLVLLLGCYGYRDVMAIPTSTHPAFAIARETYRWMGKNLPEDAQIYSPAAPTIGLYSGRQALYSDPSSDPDELRFILLRQGVTHVLAQPLQLLSFSRYSGSALSADQRWQRLQAWVSSWPDAFVPVHQEVAEGTVLYAVKSEPNFDAAYGLYREAFKSLDRADWDAALKDLDAAIRLVPQFPGALNASGVALMVSGKDLQLARTRLSKALTLRPQYPLAWVNLARLNVKTRRFIDAKGCYMRASEAIQRTSESLSLLPVIEREISSLP